MARIAAINFRNLRNGEFRFFHVEGVDFAKAITDEDLLPAIEAYESAVQELSNYLESSILESSAKKVQDLDHERNSVYMACRKVAKACVKFPDESAAETGALIWKVFDVNPSPIHLNQAQSTNVLLNIVNGLKNVDEEKLVACGFKVWLDKLESVNNQFIAFDEMRISERAQRELELGKRLRGACIEAYETLICAASFKAVNGSESCKNFLVQMNAAVLEKRQQVRTRKLRKEKAAPVAIASLACVMVDVDSAA